MFDMKRIRFKLHRLVLGRCIGYISSVYYFWETADLQGQFLSTKFLINLIIIIYKCNCFKLYYISILAKMYYPLYYNACHVILITYNYILIHLNHNISD